MSDSNKRFYAEIWPQAAAVLRAAQFLTHNDAEADDLAQEVMIKAFRHLDQLHDPRGAKAWLMTILRNARLDRIRAGSKSAKDVSLDDVGIEPSVTSAEPNAVWDEPESLLQEFSDKQVIDALKTLPEDIRWTLMLVDVEGLDKATAAQVMAIPEGTVGSRAFRGRRLLREVLTPLAKELRIIR